jgi:hypothetical protein
MIYPRAACCTIETMLWVYFAGGFGASIGVASEIVEQDPSEKEFVPGSCQVAVGWPSQRRPVGFQ